MSLNNQSIALDAASTISVRTKDDFGRLHISRAKIAHSSIDQYAINEIPNARQRLPHLANDASSIRIMRDADSLKTAVARYARVPLYLTHTNELESIDKNKIIGTVGSNVEYAFDADTNTHAIYADLCIWDADVIGAIESGAIEQLSASYSFDLDPTHGVLDDKQFDAIMRVKTPNHVALVQRARGGPTLKIGDSAMSKIDQLKSITLVADDIASDADKAAALEYHAALGKLLDVKPVEVIKTVTVASDAAPGLTQAQLDAALAAQAKSLNDAATARHAAAVDTRVTLGDIALDSADEYYTRALDELKVDRTGVSGTANLAAIYKLALRSKTSGSNVASDAVKTILTVSPVVIGKGGLNYKLPNIERTY